MSSLRFLARRTCGTHGSRLWLPDSTLGRSMSQHASRPTLQPRIQSPKRFGLGDTDDASQSEDRRRPAMQSRVPGKRKPGFGIREENAQAQPPEREHPNTPAPHLVGDSRSSFGIRQNSGEPDRSERRGPARALRTASVESTDAYRKTQRSPVDPTITRASTSSQWIDAGESPRSQQVTEEEPEQAMWTEEQLQQWSAPPMGWGAKKSKIEIYHNPDEPVSCRVLELLENARTYSFPPKSKRALEPKPVKRRTRGGPTHIKPPPPPPPLAYTLTVYTEVPTARTFRELFEMLMDTAPSFTAAFIKPGAAKYNVHPTNANDIYELATKDKNILMWPIVVCRPLRWAAVGNYKHVYAFLRKQADRRPLPKLEGTPIWDLDGLRKARAAVNGPHYLNRPLSEADLAELEEITS